MIPALDMHAHIQPTIAASELVGLNACVVAVTRRAEEFDAVRERSDPSTVWGVGCHPGLARELGRFDAKRMRQAMQATAVVGEIGLDGSARASLDIQEAVLRQVFEVDAEVPRLLSLHSYRATDQMVELLTVYRPQAAILHWWLGSPAATQAALDVGAYFSVNASQGTNWSSLNLIPVDRLFMETDHPFGDKSERGNRRPGSVTAAETAVARSLGISAAALREQTWRNLKRLCETLGLVELMPRNFQVQFLTSP